MPAEASRARGIIYAPLQGRRRQNLTNVWGQLVRTACCSACGGISGRAGGSLARRVLGSCGTYGFVLTIGRSEPVSLAAAGPGPRPRCVGRVGVSRVCRDREEEDSTKSSGGRGGGRGDAGREGGGSRTNNVPWVISHNNGVRYSLLDFSLLLPAASNN